MTDPYLYPDGHATVPGPFGVPRPDIGIPAPEVSAYEPDDDEVLLDLDTYEKPGKKRKPFWFRHQGQRWLLIDSGKADWQQTAAARRDPRLMMRLLIAPEQRDDLLSREMSNEKIAKLLADYKKHYELDAEVGDQSF